MQSQHTLIAVPQTSCRAVSWGWRIQLMNYRIWMSKRWRLIVWPGTTWLRTNEWPRPWTTSTIWQRGDDAVCNADDCMSTFVGFVHYNFRKTIELQVLYVLCHNQRAHAASAHGVEVTKVSTKRDLPGWNYLHCAPDMTRAVIMPRRQMNYPQYPKPLGSNS